MEEEHQFSLWYFLVALLAIVAIQEYFFSPGHTLVYSDFKALVRAGKVKEVALGTHARGLRHHRGRVVDVAVAPSARRRDPSERGVALEIFGIWLESHR
jgi:hypothetical protein